MKSFSQRFATDDKHNSFTLTADGCMDRHNEKSLFREHELNTDTQPFAKMAERDEALTMNAVFKLVALGQQPNAQETIPDFIMRNMSLLD